MEYFVLTEYELQTLSAKWVNENLGIPVFKLFLRIWFRLGLDPLTAVPRPTGSRIFNISEKTFCQQNKLR